MGSLEVVSMETFQQQLEGISSGPGCRRERVKESNKRSSSRRSRKLSRVKSNSPIVVRLRDTIKVSVKGKMKGSPLSSDHEYDSSSDENFPPVSSRHGASKRKSESPLLNDSTHCNKPARKMCMFRRKLRKDGKNFNAFLSAIEKVHWKDKSHYLVKNLNQYSWHSKEYKTPTDLVLNNSLPVHHTYCQSSISLRNLQPKSRALQGIDRDNIELICNDLSSEGQSSELFASAEDSETSENASVVSASDTQSESDISTGSETCPVEHLSKDELDHLREYTEGCTLTRFDCPPHECPECLAAYYACTHYYAQGSDLLKVEVLDGEDGSCCEAASTEDSRSAPDQSLPPGVTVKGPKKVEVSVAPMFQKRKKHKKSHHCQKQFDTVTIDLTNSNVTFTVTYPSDDSSSSSSSSDSDQDQVQEVQPQSHWYSTVAPPSGGYSDFCSNFYSTMIGFMPFLMPYYCMAPTFYPWTYPVTPIPRPMCLPKDAKRRSSSPRSPPQEYRRFTTSQPPPRPWIPLSHPDTTQPVGIYTVMCYNVLCDKYATRQLYGYCPSWALNWEYRKKIIIEEIRQYSADIISLQEVETDQFYNYFLPELKLEGYDGVFAPKSRARTMSEVERKTVDGCAIFFRLSKFSLIKEHLVEFNQLAIERAEGSHDMINRVMTKDNIGLAALLETKEGVWENGLPPEGQVHQPILVSTCHVHWDPEFCDVKLIQTMILMSELKNIIDDAKMSLRPGGSSAPDCNSVPLILCGDLNSLPESGVVEYLNTGSVSANHEDFKDLGYEDALRKLSISESKDVYTHGFKLSQGYTKDLMPYTNYTFDFKGVIDYIFYSRDVMRPLGILGSLDQDWFRENKVFGCPHPQIPSDHLPLLLEMEMAAHPPSGSSSSSSSGSSMASSGSRGNPVQSLSTHR